jgi:regulator of replication initiation timing
MDKQQLFEQFNQLEEQMGTMYSDLGALKKNSFH